ncbi:CDP-alcohol phosphatidyltransferase family protein [Alphaproteobacteria bacterium]|nr:CDP-alcohol phosphatidyltransferase family protein [Alphaproteobacteria bacterium]
MSKYTIHDLKKHNNEKVQFETAFLVILLRPISNILAVFLSNLGIKPNFVTFLNYFIVISSPFFLFFHDNGLILFTFMLLIWQMLDIVDGNIARLTNTFSTLGGSVDHLTGMHISAFLPFIFGLYDFNNPSNFFFDNNSYSLILGSIGSIFSILLRFIDLYLSTENKDDFVSNLRYGNSPKNLFELCVMIVRQFEYPGGLLIIILCSFALMGMLDIAVLFYFVLYILFYISFVMLLIFRRLL